MKKMNDFDSIPPMHQISKSERCCKIQYVQLVAL